MDPILEEQNVVVIASFDNGPFHPLDQSAPRTGRDKLHPNSRLGKLVGEL
jgi:hypothetical protein